MAEWLMLWTAGYKVLDSHPSGRGIQLMVLHCIEPFINTLPSSQYDLNKVERDIKHQIIIIWATPWEDIFGHNYVDSKGQDQPAHPCSLIWAFPVH